MTHRIPNRSRLLLGCGCTALAMALAFAPDKAAAQAFGGSGSVVFGSAEINNVDATTDQVDVFSQTAVIDWTPNEDVNGDALDFLPTGTTAIFESTNFQDFAVLNRILPSTNGNIAVIDGSVISRFVDVNGAAVRSGFIAFYSPTGILIGDNATFDVGSLLLTTLDTSNTDFQNFAEFGGLLPLNGAPGSTARIQINPGAQITATPENSFFAVVAADIQMLGSARINGSHAYVAGEVVNLSFSNGLFSITVPVGTAASGTVMELNGDIGGPSSTGNPGDNHMIYALAAAQSDPISMIFRGNLGFDPAQSAGVVNGEIILSANHNVFGQFVDGGSISDGINAVFGANSATSDVRADIFIEDITATSSLLAIGTHRVQALAVNGASSVSGNLLLVGRESADLSANNGQNLTVTGDVLVSAQDYGVVSSSLQSLDAISTQGGVATVGAFGGATIDIGGNALVAADAFGGADDLNRIAGTALGGTAFIGANAGTVNITGFTRISADGLGTNLSGILTGAEARGGLAQVFATQGGSLTFGSDVFLTASARGADGSLFNPSTLSNAYAGQVLMNIFGTGGTITVNGNVAGLANARGGDANAAGAGSIGVAGQARLLIEDAGLIDITGAVDLSARGTGGENTGGIGGAGLGGRATAATLGGGTIAVGTTFDSDATGVGGGGLTGGDGLGGIAGANAVIGAITIGARASAISEGVGGSAIYGFGGNGGIGRGGNATFQADGTLTQTATLSIGGDAVAIAQGSGGNGGQADGSVTPAGRGGDAYGGEIAVPNQADPAFGSGAYLLAGGDNGTISVGGDAVVLASAFAGSGGIGDSVTPGGRGGDAFGGQAQAGLALLGGDGSLGQGSATLVQVFVEANAFGGTGGFSFGDFPTGDGGNAIGGDALLTAHAGSVTTDAIALDANGYGGDGANGGLGTGGSAAGFGSLGGSLSSDLFTARADGFGGYGGFDFLSVGTAGNGQGGQAELDFQGITVQINGDATVQAEGSGGSTGEFTAGNGTGGTARLGVLGATVGSGTVTGNTIVSANGFGGGADSGLAALSGDGFGGTASVRAQGGGSVSLATLQAMANGFGGQGEILGYVGGDGTGGAADITATGTGSQIVIASNVTNALFTDQNFGAILSANGVGGLGSGGAGIGGTGRGGTVTVAARLGGSVALPATPLADPDSVGAIGLFARGFGGNTTINGGVGGTSFGGSAVIDVDGGSLTMGETELSSFVEGGTASGSALNVTGGDAFAGSRTVSVRGGGNATLFLLGSGVGARGGAGTGTGDGGDAFLGQNLFAIDNATVNIIGEASVFDQSVGGAGQQGGSVFAVNPFTGLTGSLTLTLDNADVTFTPDGGGAAGIGMSFVTRGGTGVTRGGNAQGPNVNVTINQTDLAGGRLDINPFVQGGDALALDGIGGDALGALITIAITGSQLTLPGETRFAADALGGAGGANGAGGSGTSGSVDATITGSTINLVADQQGVPGSLRLSANGSGRLGGTVGDGTSIRAVLDLVDSSITGSQLLIEAQGGAASGNATQIGGDAIGGEARLSLEGTSAITADLILLNTNAGTGQGGTATGGLAVLEAGSGSTATLTAGQVTLSADGLSSAASTGGIAGETEGGEARLGAVGGSLSITGNVQISANATGAFTDELVAGATARAGLARVFAEQGGSLSIGQSLFLNAGAFGSIGSLANPATGSDAFGGSAILEIGTGGGTVTIGGDASVTAGATGGGANGSGAGGLADAGTAIANIAGAGTMTINGQLVLGANARGGDNAGGLGGTALGGRASASTFGGGTIAVGGNFASTARAQGGNGVQGGDAFGGITGANAVAGTIDLGANASADAQANGGQASFGFGGTGGFARGGNAFFQADGSAALAAELLIAGNASVLASGFGGRGGDSDGNTIAAGRGGDGVGGEITTPNQADTAFGSGAYLLAGGDYGTLSVGGSALVAAQGSGGQGGSGAGQIAGGRGGDGLGGLAQAGLALLGGPGTVGGGSATFATLVINGRGFGGRGGIDPQTDAVIGEGGNGTGGSALLTLHAGDVTASQVQVQAQGNGGEGAGIGGTGTGGAAEVFGSLGGTLTASRLDILAQGSGGFSPLGTGGDGFGGVAEIEVDGIAIQINGNLVLDASGSGAASDDGAGGTGQGGEAYIGQVGPGISGILTVTGHTQVFANGVGGSTLTDFAGGDGIGGHAWVRSQGGSRKTFGSIQVAAVGRGGSAQAHRGGNGTGGLVQLQSFGTGSSLVIQRNVPTAFASTLGGAAILNASGAGADTRGGDGIGGTGDGGTVELVANGGGSLNLPTNVATDPDSASSVLLVTAGGVGGGSAVEGGAGGDALGGSALIEANGASSSIVMGETVLSAFAQGGNSLDTTLNIGGGRAFGGNRRIRVLNGASATLGLSDGTSGGEGGDGSGTGNGGNAFGGLNRVELIDGTLNIVGLMSLSDRSTGGNGNRGGDAFGGGEGGGISFSASNSTVTFTPDASGQAGIALGGISQGGQGVVAGGNAQAQGVFFSLVDTDLNGGTLVINPVAQGGSASAANGVGGDALGSPISATVTNSTLDLAGESLIASDARGGSGGTGGTGGSAASGAIDVSFIGAAIAIATDANGNPGILRLRSRADGGEAATMGNATSGRAFLNLAGTTLDAAQVSVEARGFASANSAGQTGGNAIGGQALINLSGDSAVTAGLIEIVSNAESSAGGTTAAGTSSLQVAGGSTATVDADTITLLADAFGGGLATPANAAGQFFVNIGGGSVNAGSLFASALGDLIAGDPPASELVASGGSLNVSDSLTARAFDDILIRTGSGGIIGGPRAAATTTTVRIDTQGEITIEGDNPAAIGLGGDSINLNARDVEIANGARIGADRVTITSLDRAQTAILGGNTQGDGFTLTGDEIGRINARELSLNIPGLANPATPNQTDLLIRDLSVSGSRDNGLALLRIFVGSDLPDGIVRVEGTLSYISAGADDRLAITADRLEVVTPGGIRIEESDGVPGGILALAARDIWVADADTIAQLQADRGFAGRDALLAAAAAGSDDPLGYLRARGVTLDVGASLLVRNTGVALEGGGILVGDGGLSITGPGASQSGPGGELDVFAHGRRRAADGSFVLGEDFFDEVNFNRVAPGSTLYLDAAAFNDCIINTGECPQPPPPPEPPVEPPPQINNPTVVFDPVVAGDEPRISREEEEDSFGIDFPEQPDAPLISEDPLLDDPVTSGGDASLYSGGGAVAPRGEDE